MTSAQTLAIVTAIVLLGEAVAEFFATHKPFFTALAIVAFSVFMVYCVQRSNRRNHEPD